MDNRGKATPVFVGRERELEELAGGLVDAARGKGRLFLVAGEPGIGKSSLADEVALRAREHGFEVVWGRCWEAGGAPAYWPWVQSLRSHVRGLDGGELLSQLAGGAPYVAQVVPEIAEALPDLSPPPPMEPSAGRFRLFDAVTTLLHNAGLRQPLMLVLDDLHAADTPSLLLLQFVARELCESRVMVLAAYRNVELDRDHPLTLALAELSRQKATSHVPLLGLSGVEVAGMIEETVGIVPSESVVAAVHRETEGNPLFVSEVVRLLAAEGGLERVDDPAALRLALPVGIREVIERRIGRLSDECSTTLALASVFGREFSLEAVGRLSGRPPSGVLDLLDEAMAARVVAEVPGAPGRCRFAHALIRDTLYDSLGAGRRLRLHQQAGETLETLYQPRVEPHLAELAHHFFEAAPIGEAAKAIDYAQRAGRAALALLAYEEAVRLFRMALTALDLDKDPGERTRCRLLLALGTALDRAGERQAAKDELLRAADIARREGMVEELGEAALAYGGRFAFTRGASDARMISLLQDARAALAGRGPLRVRVLARLAAAMRDQADRGPRDELSREAVELARTFDDPSTLAYALTARCAALFGPDDPEWKLALAEELRDAARAAFDKETEVEGESSRALALLALGRMTECWKAVEAMERLADDLRQPSQRWFAAALRAHLALLEGQFSIAEGLIESALRFGKRSHPFDAIGFSRVQFFALRREDGRLAEMEPEARRSVEEYPTRPLFRCLLASLFAELGDKDQARAAFEPLAATRFADLPVNNDLLLSLALVVEVAWFLGDTERASALYDLLLPYQGMVVDTAELSVGAVDRYLGLAAMAAGGHERADRHLRDAMALNTRIGAQPWVVRTQRDLAARLLTRDGPGDRDRATDLLRSALATAERLEMTTTAARIREQLFPSGVTPAPVVTIGPLSRREAEVAALVAEGLTNKQIGGRLYLSERTAQNHVQHILTKLGFASRSQIAAWYAGTHQSQRGDRH